MATDWTKMTVQTIPAGILDKRFTTYFASESADPPFHMRISMMGVDSQGRPYQFDHALSELSISAEQKAMLIAADTAVADRVLSLQDFVADE